MISLTVVTILVPIVFLAFVLELIRREKLTFKYGVGWLFLGILALLLVIFKKWLFAVAFYLGFELPSNFIFFSLLAFFVFLSLLLTTFVCQQEKHNITMAQRIALLEEEVKELKGRKAETHKNSPEKL